MNMENKPDKYISERGYTIKKSCLSEEEHNKIKKDLTVSPFTIQGYTNMPTPKFKVYLESKTKYYLPRFYGISKFGKVSKNYLEELDHGENIAQDFNGQLKEIQVPIASKMIDELKSTGGGILNLHCGMGKTVLAIYIIAQMKKKTLIIVHKEFLMNQWKERLNQFLPNAKVGIIQQNKVKVENHDVVIAMLQSVAMKSYERNIYESFGFTIVDEAHHISSQVFSRALPKISTRYMLGLSATLDRKDGLRRVFEWYLGKPTVCVQNMDVGEVVVNVIKLNDPQYQVPFYNGNGKLNLAKLINTLVISPKRMKIILDWIKKFVKDNRKILVLSERRKHLEDIDLKAKELGLECGFYFGGLSQQKLKESESKQIILGTYHMISEGFDLSSLDSLIFASPKTDVVQATGRILRQGKNRKTIPTIVDIEDQIDYLKKKSKTRISYYKKNKFTINVCD